MKVKEVMSRQVDYVTVDTTVREVARLIFGRNIHGVPVCDERKVVIGLVTEQDILTKFYPSMSDYIQDPLREGDFEAMEKKAGEILNLPVSRIMSRDPKTISPDTPILKAQSLIQVAEIGRLPVVDPENRLIGVISKGDIFRATVGKNLDFGDEEKFYDWLSKHYDIFIHWKKRLAAEIPEISNLLHKARAKRILDVASSTGEHSIAFAKQGFEVYGIDASRLISEMTERKKNILPESLKKRINFLWGEYEDIIDELPRDLDAALFLGNALPHVFYTNKNILEDINKVLNPQKSMMIFQIFNFERFLDKTTPIDRFVVRSSRLGLEKKHAFLSFYTKERNRVLYSQAIFEFDGEKWRFSGMNSTSVAKIDRVELRRKLRKLGFNNIKYYGGKMYEPLFRDEFDPKKSESLNIIAKR